MTTTLSHTNHRNALFAGLLVFALLSAPSVFAQGSGVMTSGWVSDVQIAVWELPSRNEIARIKSGGSFDLSSGQAVMLRVFSPRDGNGSGERKYLSARISVAQGGNAVDLRNVDSGKGSAELHALPRAAGRTITVNYELRGNYQTRGIGKSGSVRARVGGGGGGTAPPATGGPVAAGAEGEVQRLFRGILMREPNNAADDFVRRVRRDGHPALVAVAYQIAGSRESVGMGGRVSPEERLEAMYLNLLDRRRGQVSDVEWNDQIDRIRAGRVADAVMDIVQSETFKRRYDRR